MPIQLFVNFADKDKVKKLGAKWDSNKKSWYLTVSKKENLDYCYKWLSKEQQECKFFIPYNNLYLYKITTSCYKCNNEIDVICFSSICYENDYKFNYVYTYITLLGKEIIDFITTLKKYDIKYEKRYSLTEKKSYYMNICKHCNSHQGDNFMFLEHKSPFLNLDDINNIEKNNLECKFDVPMSSNLISSSNYNITLYPNDYFDGKYYDEDCFLIKKNMKKD